MRYRLGFFAILFSLSTHAYAAVEITPTLNPSDETRRAIVTNKGVATAILEGAGDRVRMIYSAKTPLHATIAPMRREDAVDPADTIFFMLPAGTSQEVIIDLTLSPHWQPASQKYFFSITKPTLEDDTAIEAVEFLPATQKSIRRAALGHLGIREDFTVSSVHALRGYSILGRSLSGIVGMSALLLAGIVFVLARRSAPLAPVGILLAASCLYSLFFGFDLVRFTTTHLSEWSDKKTYGEMGSAVAIGKSLREMSGSGDIVFTTCDTSTDYYAKAVRYFAYPVPISHGVRDDATHILTPKERDWTFEGNTLRCGSLQTRAALVREFPDGAHLFQITR